jgi:hypothetical protein
VTCLPIIKFFDLERRRIWLDVWIDGSRVSDNTRLIDGNLIAGEKPGELLDEAARDHDIQASPAPMIRPVNSGSRPFVDRKT